MVGTGFLKKKVKELYREAVEIQEKGIEFLEAIEFDEDIQIFYRPDYRSSTGIMQRDLVKRYQRWYSTTFRLVEELMPEWRDTFVEHYKSPTYGVNGALDYLTFDFYMGTTSKETKIANFIKNLDIQIAILQSIPDAVEVKELNLRRVISADIAATEIEQAEILFATGFHRAAGSIAGVALELHLKTLCDINNVAYKPKATIEPLAQALYDAKLLDVTELKRIQYLGSIRNKCSHPNDVSEKEVQTLLDSVKKLV